MTLEVGAAFLCTNDPDHLASSKVFRRELTFLAEMALEIDRMRSDLAKAEFQRTNRLLHNLIKLNALEIQELFALVPQEQIASTGYKAQIGVVQKIVLENISDAASTILRLMKNAASVKSEFSAYKKIHGELDQLRPLEHSVHKVILNATSLFYQTFLERDLRVTLGESDSYIILDYDSVQVALYHILDNACKYAERDSEIRILFEDSPQSFNVIFDMDSLYIPDNELGNLFKPGFCGSQPNIVGSAGNGVGMGLSQELLTLNYAELRIQNGVARLPRATLALPGLRYASNRFIIAFPRSSVVERRIRRR